MYVTLVQNISASMRSVSSLCDSLKHLNLHQIDLFLSQNLAITCYSTLYEKRTLFICIYLYKIDTGPITYLIGACQFKSFLLGSQDLKVNLCGLQQDKCSDGVK